MLASSLTSSTRSFVQGAPPLPQRVTDKNNKERPRGSYREEMDSERARRQRAIHEFFATHEPNCPEPLEENAFVKGQFGMRRRYFVDHRGKIDSIALGAAVADSTNAMRK
ncbi:putative mitochondrial hypothetical protein [Leptomonas pyrrhocoris]|uniref:Uncharacterized protein n=1 Tax=Leptomonas pyrrhocoris TaxID=157538 RepID=A0A0N0DU82_LEPPY|nr:putative mitochondrial hypothetical protein [Leptomonas pyrrhocoris]XP_015656937.1 putative mitochondrial hypothetical protein [Leptomonas pyrrhocoris]KPA78497.1 putative mitochondrial hypothetical protein [Leptomonas pyrrhocoris]KPA78498.1 putative mitochondrial hypothetical protein [Leptomonas pyrrhocoris]|eukprot:XP_015656936.1 putative mitochondrial hypothetical protein [Leptomonas pyrrhocoris]